MVIVDLEIMDTDRPDDPVVKVPGRVQWNSTPSYHWGREDWTSGSQYGCDCYRGTWYNEGGLRIDRYRGYCGTGRFRVRLLVQGTEEELFSDMPPPKEGPW